MIILLRKTQLGLFDMPVHVAGSVKKDGTVTKPHIRVQKVALKLRKPAQRPSTMDMFDVRPRAEPANKTPPKLDFPTVEVSGDTWHVINTGTRREDGKVYAHLSSTTRGRPAKNGVQPVQMADYIDLPAPKDTPAPEIVEHVTKRGRTLRGVIRRDLTAGEAKQIDEYTFRKDGGWFIREKHLAEVTPASPAAPDPKTDPPASFGVQAGISKSARREINARVVALLSSDQGTYSDDDKRLLRQYSGNGGCGDSLNEFYTDPDVAAATWSVLAGLGVDHGTALEPSCGTGVFLHTAPAGIKVTGVELDPISAKAAAVLHDERHEVVNASLERFSTQDDRQFDVVIGNAPFGLRGSLVKDDKPNRRTAEGYFLDTSLDKCKPGGIVAMIVPTGVLDAKSNRKLRLDLLRKGEFLGAVRMPNTAFEHSHTEVTTDIVFYRKRGDDVAGAMSTLTQDQMKAIGVWDDDYLSGAYFEARGAANVMGTMEPGWRAKAGIGQDITVSGSMMGVPEAIVRWRPDTIERATPSVPDVLSALTDQKAKERAMGAALVRPYQLSKVGDTKVVDGVTYILQGRPPRWHRVDELTSVPSVTDAEGIADDIDRLLQGQDVDREALEAAVRGYVDKHGIPSKVKELELAASQNKVLYRLIGAVKPDGTLSDAVTGRARKAVAGSMDAVAESLVAERQEGVFTSAELADRLGKSEDEIEDALFASPAYAYLSGNSWTTMGQYLTGELWSKLDFITQQRHAVNAPLPEGVDQKLTLQARRLEETIAPASLEDVEVAVNSAFLPTDIVASYFNERNAGSGNEWLRKHTDLQITFDGGIYTVTGGDQHNNKLLDKYLNRTGVKQDELPTIDRMNADFKLWLLSSQYRDQVEDLYNRKFKGFVPQEFSNEPIEIPGMSAEGLKDYQYGGVRWALSAGKGIIAADVGLGKTVRALMLARLAKINGQAEKPTIVVPKSVLANWVAEAEKWFPGSNVLVIGETYSRDKDGQLQGKPDTAAERNRKFHEMTQNDYDFVFISQPAFNDLDLDPITKGDYVNGDFWVQRGDKLGNAGDKRLRKVREAYNQAIANREFQKRTDAIFFNDLGIDMLIVDEGHGYKNLYAARARFGESPKFLGGQGLSNRALDMNLKTRWVRENNQGKGVFMLTATPTKNSPLEIYSMLSHIAPEAFERIGIRNSEEFLDRFCEFKRESILATDGTIQEALVTTGFKNLGELREIMKRYIDRKTAADVGLKLPERNDQMHMIDMSPQQESVYQELRAQLAESAGKKDATGDAHIFSIMDKMAKAAMDLELLGTQYGGSVSPKYQSIASKVAAGAKEGGQIVFSEAIASHGKIVAALVDAGIPRNQIAIINAQEAPSSAKRQNIADALNAGKIKVVIGNKTMEEGVNLQKSTTDIHNLDLPWEPATMQQRIGRGLRQGNLNESVRIHTYISKGSFDGYRYQSMMAKKDWQDILWSGGDRVENLAREGRFDRSDLMIMMSADPEAERAKIAANKAAAEEAHAAVKREEAAAEFVRFQSMRRSFDGLKNKGTASANRLRANIERAKTHLSNNKHFGAKDLVESGADALIHPATGLALHTGVGLEITDGNGDHGRWVVTGVDIDKNDVRLRRYGALTAHGNSMSVKASDLSRDTKPFKFDHAEESDAIKTKMESEFKDKAGAITKWDQIKEIPSHVIESNHDSIQRQLWSGIKEYKISAPYGRTPVIRKDTGEVELAESYDLRGDKDQTHDFALPIDKHRDAILNAWMNEERRATFGSTFSQAKRGKSTQFAVKRYPTSKYSDHAFSGNPYDSALATVHGESHSSYGRHASSVLEARKQLAKEQVQRIRRAPTLQTALTELTALGELGDKSMNGAKVAYPKRALAMAWAKAKSTGVLGAPFAEHAPENKHASYAFSGRHSTGENVHDALIRTARRSGHHDLAAAMAVSGLRHHKDSTSENTLRALSSGYDHTPDTLRTIMKVADHIGAADVPLSQLRDYDGLLSTHQWAPDRERKVRDVINERLGDE